MGKKSDFTEQEWEALQKGLVGAGLLVSLSDRSFFDSFKEAGALGKHVATAKQRNQSGLRARVEPRHGRAGDAIRAADGEDRARDEGARGSPAVP